MFLNSREAGKFNFIYSNECENLQITLYRLKHCLLSFTQACMREGESERGRGCYVYIRVQRIEFLHFQSLHRTASRQYEAKKKTQTEKKTHSVFHVKSIKTSLTQCKDISNSFGGSIEKKKYNFLDFNFIYEKGETLIVEFLARKMRRENEKKNNKQLIMTR